MMHFSGAQEPAQADPGSFAFAAKARTALDPSERLVVVDVVRLQALQDALRALLEGIEDPQDPLARQAADALAGLLTKPVMQTLRTVRGDLDQGGEQALMVVPPGVSDDAAGDALQKAVHYAAAATADGQTGDYFETLRAHLAQELGAHFTSQIEVLSTTVAWDEGVFPEEPNKLPAQGDQQWAWVRFTNPDDLSALEGDLSDGELMDGSGTVRLQDDAQGFIGFACRLTYRYPRSDRYGVPDSATDSGARSFIVNNLGFACSRDLEILTEDTGDDSVESFEVECLVPRSVLVDVEQAPRPREGARGQV